MEFSEIFYLERRLPELVFKKAFDFYFLIADGYVRGTVDNETFSNAIINFNKYAFSSNIIIGCLQFLNKENIVLSQQSSADDYMYALHSPKLNSPVLATDCLNLVIREEKDNYAIYADHQLDLPALRSVIKLNEEAVISLQLMTW